MRSNPKRRIRSRRTNPSPDVSVLARGGKLAVSVRRAECPIRWSPARACPRVIGDRDGHRLGKRAQNSAQVSGLGFSATRRQSINPSALQEDRSRF
jgi:hypothetical protein